MTTVQQVKDFLNIDGPQLLRLQAWLNLELGIEGSTPTNLADYIRNDLKEKILAKELGMAQDQVAKPTF